MQPPISAFLFLVILALSSLITCLPTIETNRVNAKNRRTVFIHRPTSTSVAASTGPEYALSVELSDSYLILYGKSTTFTNPIPTPWPVEAATSTITTTFSHDPAVTQTRIIEELIVSDVSTTYTIILVDLATASTSLLLSQWTPIWTTGSAMNFTLVADSGFATNVAPSTSSTRTGTSSSFFTAVASLGMQSSIIESPTSASKAAGETLVAGIGALVGVALGIVVVL